MSYETTDRTIALNPEAVATLFPQLLAQYGEPLPDGAESILTIGGHWDDSDKTRIRAASLHKGTITGQPLTDGRVAFTCLWQSDLAAAFDAGDIAGVAELSAEELAGLMPRAGGDAMSYWHQHFSTVERGALGTFASLGSAAVSMVSHLEVYLRIAGLCVGLAVGIVTLLSVYHDLRRKQKEQK
jgi:hypothetical protein